MKEKILEIKEGQRFNEVLPLIPTDSIVYKTLPGLGATFTELTAFRNSIVIEPNVPVIKGKEHKHNEVEPIEGIRLIGVYKGVSQKDIEDFIIGDIPYKKIVTTPEGFISKVMPAFRVKEIDCYSEYFLLYDECEKAIQDSNYRAGVIAPIEDFFLFDGKAMISATPILPSDPRFQENGFKMIKIKPVYEYEKKLNLFHTNCVSAALEATIKKLKGNFFIFLNGTDVTHQLIRTLGIENETTVFCAEDSVTKLKNEYAFENATSELRDEENKLKEFSKYNFFTSRFYSAVDIELDYKPNVIIISHLHFAPFTIVDPATEVIQILGRFRNGLKSLIHITSTNPEFEFKTREQALVELKKDENSYNDLFDLYQEVFDPNDRKALKGALDKFKFKKFTITESEKSFFLIDNYLDEIVVRGYYNSLQDLESAYIATQFFKIKVIESFYKFTDADLKNWNRKKSNKTVFREITEKLSGYNLDINSGIPNYLRKQHPEMIDAYYRLGKQKITELDFNIRKANLAVTKLNAVEKKESTPVRTAVQQSFKLRDYLERDIKRILALINSEFNIEVPLTIQDLSERYFIMTGRKTLTKYGQPYGKGYRFKDYR